MIGFARNEEERRLQAKRERYVHEVFVEEGAPESNPATPRMRSLLGLVSSLIATAVVAGFLLLVTELELVSLGVIIGLSLLFLLQWSVWLTLMARVHHRNRRHALEVAAARHPEAFPERS